MKTSHLIFAACAFTALSAPALADDDMGSLSGYVTITSDYRFRGVSQNAELWVADDLDFPEGDCRNDGIRNVITDAQVAYMLGEFDNVILPIDTEWFGDPAIRTGRSEKYRVC